MEIRLSYNNKIFAVADYVKINPYALTTAREFTFYNVKFSPDFKDEDLYWVDCIVVEVFHDTHLHKLGRSLGELKFDCLDYMTKEDSVFWVNCLVLVDAEKLIYDQSLIDMFDMWRKGSDLDWTALELNSRTKMIYLGACFNYRGLSSKLEKKKAYIFDFFKIKEEADFLYYAGIEFVGKRGYMGYSINLFEDCLLTSHRHVGYFDESTVHFKNTNSFFSKEVEDLYHSVKSIFLKYKFNVIG